MLREGVVAARAAGSSNLMAAATVNLSVGVLFGGQAAEGRRDFGKNRTGGRKQKNKVLNTNRGLLNIRFSGTNI